MRRRSSTVRWFDLAILLTGVVLAFVSLWLGTGDTLWKLFPLPQDLRPGFTWTLSILFLLAGFLIASYQQLESLSRRAEKDREDLLAEVGRIAAGNGLRAMTADDALREIASKLPAARAIWNTRISEKLPNEPMVTPVRREYDAALRRAVIDEGVSYREVLAPSWESTVCAQFAVRTRRATALASSVNLSVVQAPTPSFVNFIVIEYKDRTQEMYWGWAISRNRGPEQECFHLVDKRLTNYYVLWHTELFAAGHPLSDAAIDGSGSAPS
jgi:hypothetical protein